MTTSSIGTLFARNIHRRIEEVIKVDQTDEQIILDEIAEYVVTHSIRDRYRAILDRYQETPNKPHEGIGIWISGFFGSGKSSFAKLLGYAIADRLLTGQSAAQRFSDQTGDPRIQVQLQTITEQIPTEAVIFDISSNRGIRTGSQTVTEIMYRLFLEQLGYAKNLELAELEITLESEGRLQQFEETFANLYQQSWNEQKGLVVVALNRASRVMHELEPITFPTPDSWVQASKERTDITPALLARRCRELMDRRRPGEHLIFVIDEIGQFVARDVQKMLDLQAVVQNLGSVGRGRMWLVVTSQEKLNELVGSMDDRRIELARLIDRFPQELQVHLEPADISEVTSRRVLTKHADAQHMLRTLFAQHRGSLEQHTRLTADIRLPELTTEGFINLYPLLPYQVDLIIQVVSGLRTQGGSSKHVGGANRTIIKLAQQVLINPVVNLTDKSVGVLVRLDQIYDLVQGNITSDIRGKIDAIPEQVEHPLAQAVAKTICLLQFVQSVHRTAENIAAGLHPSVDADSQRSAVQTALDALVQARLVRSGDDGYRIPTPTEDDWERQRDSLRPSSSEATRLQTDIIGGFWSHRPSLTLLQTRTFTAGLTIQGHTRIDGDVPFHIYLSQGNEDYTQTVEEARSRSQIEDTAVFWVVRIDPDMQKTTDEWYRSREMLNRKNRGTQGGDASKLVSEETQRSKRHENELKHQLERALLHGTVFFRGNDRSPDEHAPSVNRSVSDLLGLILPEIFDRFADAAARVQSKDLEALVQADSLHGMTPVFVTLNLLQDQGGKPTFVTDHGPLSDVLAQIANKANYGDEATGRYLTEVFGRAPYGWEFDMVRLLAAALLRAGKIEMTSKGQVIESATTLEARTTLKNNNLFRQAAFRPKVGTLTFADFIAAAEAYKNTFGRDIPELEQGPIVRCIREEINRVEPEVQEMQSLLDRHTLPGAEVLSEALNQIRAIRTGREEAVITGFTSSAKHIKEAVGRTVKLREALTEPALVDVQQAREALTMHWPILQHETDLDETTAQAAATLDDLLRQEMFYQELPHIRQHTARLREAYARREQEALEQRHTVYTQALADLADNPGWAQLTSEQQDQMSQPLRAYATAEKRPGMSIAQIRADNAACSARLNTAIDQMWQLIEGNRLERVSVGRFFQGSIETEEELEAALEGLRQEIASLIGKGKKVLVR